MNTPIQSAPINREDRAVSFSSAKGQGLMPQMNVCDFCRFLPPPLNEICQRVCPVVLP